MGGVIFIRLKFRLKNKHKKFIKQIIPFIIVMILYSALLIPISGFMGAYLAHRGVETTFIGTILSVSNILGFIGTYVLSFFCDKYKNIKKIIMVALIVIFLLAVIVLPNVSGNVLYISVVGILGFFQVPLLCLLDTWILTSNYYVRQYFGLIRSGASFGYAVFALFYGGLIDAYGWTCMFVFSAIFIILILIFATIIKDNYKEMFNMEEENDEEQPKKKNILHLFKNKDIVIILIVTFLIFLPSNTINTYLFYIIKHLGGGTKEQGIALFVQAISEIPALMLFPILIKRFKSKNLMLFASINYLIRMVLTYFAPNVTSIILIYLIQSITYAIYLPNMRHYVDKYSPKELKTTAQSFVESGGIGLSAVVGNLIGGFILEYYSLKTMLFMCIIFSAIAVAFLIYVVISSRNEDKNAIKS